MDWNKAGCRHKLNAILRLVVVAKICRDLCRSSLAGSGQVPSSVLTTLEMFKREFSVIIAWNTLSWSHILHCTPLYPKSRGLDLTALLNDRITTLWVPLSLIFSFQLPISDAANQPVWQSGFCWGSHPTATLLSIPHPAKPAGRAAPSLLTDTSPAHFKLHHRMSGTAAGFGTRLCSSMQESWVSVSECWKCSRSVKCTDLSLLGCCWARISQSAPEPVLVWEEGTGSRSGVDLAASSWWNPSSGQQ